MRRFEIDACSGSLERPGAIRASPALPSVVSPGRRLAARLDKILHRTPQEAVWDATVSGGTARVPRERLEYIARFLRSRNRPNPNRQKNCRARLTIIVTSREGGCLVPCLTLRDQKTKRLLESHPYEDANDTDSNDRNYNIRDTLCASPTPHQYAAPPPSLRGSPRPRGSGRRSRRGVCHRGHATAGRGTLRPCGEARIRRWGAGLFLGRSAKNETRRETRLYSPEVLGYMPPEHRLSRRHNKNQSCRLAHRRPRGQYLGGRLWAAHACGSGTL